MCIVSMIPSIGLLFVVLVCSQVLADKEGRGSTDGPVSVVVDRKTASTSLVGSCSSSKTVYKVRFQTVKGATRSFRRVLMSMTTIVTYASKMETVSSQHIGDCANKADKGGFAGFSFVDGMCKMFTMGGQPCKCDVGTGDVIYVQDSFWDVKEFVLPHLVPAGNDLMELVRFPRTVFDQRQNLDDAFYYEATEIISGPIEVALMAKFKNANGVYVFFCSDAECRRTYIVDTEHCSMGCNGSSNLVNHRQYSYLSERIDKISPTTYFLSECGNTIIVNGTFPSDQSLSLRQVLSHKGYGCQWYPKEDDECAVTFVTANTTLFMVNTNGFDGDDISCEGDSISIYNGTKTDGVLLTTNACFNGRTRFTTANGPSRTDVVFKRSARQYRPDGFNLGFVIELATNKN